MWKVSTASVDGGWSARSHGLPCLREPVDVPSPGQRLEGDRDAVLGGQRPRRVQLLGGAGRGRRPGVRRDVGARQHQGAPSSAIDAELGAHPVQGGREPLRRPRPRRRGPAGTGRSPSPRSAQRCGDLARAGAGEATRSLSKISMPSNPAAAIAGSLSRAPRAAETVAMPLRIRRSAPRSAASSGRVGDPPGEVLEGPHCLVHGHATTRDHPAAAGPGEGDLASATDRCSAPLVAAPSASPVSTRSPDRSVTDTVTPRCADTSWTRSMTSRPAAAGRGSGPAAGASWATSAAVLSAASLAAGPAGSASLAVSAVPFGDDRRWLSGPAAPVEDPHAVGVHREPELAAQQPVDSAGDVDLVGPGGDAGAAFPGRRRAARRPRRRRRVRRAAP